MYLEHKGRPTVTPGQRFINELCAVTKKSEPTVRRWICDGATAVNPDALTQDVLAKHFGVTVEELFPGRTTR